MNYYLEKMNELEADGIDFVPVCQDMSIPFKIIESYTKQELMNVKYFPKTGCQFWKFVDGDKRYINSNRELRKTSLPKCSDCIEKSNCYGNMGCDEIINGLEKLKEYKDTGLEPEEIEKLKQKEIKVSREIVCGSYFCPKCGNPAKPGYCQWCGQKIY